MQKDYYERGKCPHISFHINLDEEDEIESEQETLSIIKENVEVIKKTFDYNILLENVPAKRQERRRDFLSKPEFICQVLEKTNTLFLLDISHARSAAYTLDIPFMDYINALPLNKIKEIHLAGCVKGEDGRIVPNHSKMNQEDYELLRYLLKKCKDIDVLTLEYGPYDVKTHQIIPTYNKVDNAMKKEVYENLLKLNQIIKKK